MSGRRGLALVVLLPLLVAGCASTGTGAADPAAEIEALKTRVLELQRKAAVAEVEIARLRQQVGALESSRPAESPAAGAPAARPSAPAPGEAVVPPAAPAPAIEIRDLDEPAGLPPAAAPPAAAPAPAPAPGARPDQPVPAAAQALYDEAYTQYHQGRYVDAEAAFQRFLQAYPQSDLSDNAVFWIGECRSARGDLKGALAAFRQVLDAYPDGNKVPDALLEAGQCLQGLGDLDGARASYRDVVRRFPQSAAAETAREKLAALR
ncbi:MAG: tol-pal system protein YbgF [Acidobacteriota bacterium]